MPLTDNPPASHSHLIDAVMASAIGIAESADFSTNTLTFSIPPTAHVGAGRYVLVPELLARDAIRQDQHAAQAKPHGLSLAGPQRETVQAECYGVNGKQALEIDDGEGYECRMYRDHTPNGSDDWHPAHWWGTEYRQADDGTKWQRSLPPHVTDDFGQLVPVVGGAQ